MGSIVRVGTKPVFVDVNPDTHNIDPAGIEEKITEKTRAVIPVHLFGQVRYVADTVLKFYGSN